MRVLKSIKRVGACIAFISSIILSCFYSSTLATYSISMDRSVKIFFSTLLTDAYSSYFFLFFIVAFSFPLIAGLLDKKASSIALSSLSLAFLVPLLVQAIKAMDPYFSMEYNGSRLSSCTLDPTLLIVIIFIGLLLLSNLVILICSAFIRDDKQ